jgi:hypothetical protein
MSWIWAARRALDDQEQELHDCEHASIEAYDPSDLARPLALQVEWARAKSRKTRWDEEVNVLREEMRRILRYLSWETEVWEARAELTRDDQPVEVQAGLKAYAHKQGDLHRSLRAFYFQELSIPLEDAAAALAFDDGDLPALFAQGQDGGMCLAWNRAELMIYSFAA